MAKFIAYLDDSGTHADSLHYTVAGYIAPTDSWSALSDEWKRALSRWNLTWFHMASAENGSGDFKTWRDIARRRRCIHAFARIVGKHVALGLHARLEYPAFKRHVAGA